MHQRPQRVGRLAGRNPPTQQKGREFLLAGTGDKGGPGDAIHLGLHPDPRPHLANRLNDFTVVNIAIIRPGQHDAEPLGVAGISQKLLGSRHVVRDRWQIIHMSGHAGGEELVGRNGRALHHPLDNRRPVNTHAQRLPHPQIVQRIGCQRFPIRAGDQRMRAGMAAVQPQKHQAQTIGLRQRHPLIGPQPRHVGGRHKLHKRHIASQEGCGAGAVIGDHPHAHIGPMRLLAPVAIIAHQLRPVAGAIGGQPIRPGADGVLAAVELLGQRVRPQRLRQHRHLGQVNRQQRIHARGFQPDGVRVHNLGRHHRLGVNGETAGGIRHRRHPGNGIGHIGGGEIRAIMPLHPLAQLQLPGLRVHQSPAFRQIGNRPRFRVHLDQRVEDMAVQRQVGRKRMVMRINRRYRAGQRHHQRLRPRHAGGKQHGRNRGCNTLFHHRPVPLAATIAIPRWRSIAGFEWAEGQAEIGSKGLLCLKTKKQKNFGTSWPLAYSHRPDYAVG